MTIFIKLKTSMLLFRATLQKKNNKKINQL